MQGEQHLRLEIGTGAEVRAGTDHVRLEAHLHTHLRTCGQIYDAPGSDCHCANRRGKPPRRAREKRFDLGFRSRKLLLRPGQFDARAVPLTLQPGDVGIQSLISASRAASCSWVWASSASRAASCSWVWASSASRAASCCQGLGKLSVAGGAAVLGLGKLGSRAGEMCLGLGELGVAGGELLLGLGKLGSRRLGPTRPLHSLGNLRRVQCRHCERPSVFQHRMSQCSQLAVVPTKCKVVKERLAADQNALESSE